MSTQEALEGLTEIANRKTAFIGLGNRERGDDAIGLRFVDDLRHLNPKYFFSEEQGLESIILQIVNDKEVEKVVFVDSCDIGSRPGEQALLKVDAIDETISTHKVPLSMLMALIQKKGKDTFLFGIQPKSLDFKSNITEVLLESLEKIKNAMKNKLKGN